MRLNRKFLVDTFGYGFLLWLLGYFLGIVLFMIVPPGAIGWIITPIATIITIWILFRRIKSSSFQYYLSIAVIWTMLAVMLDYFLLVKLFNPEDGYYKFDVYLYYSLTFLLPLIVGMIKQSRVRVS